MWRHHPATARLLELLPEVGTLRVVRAAFSFVDPDPSWTERYRGLRERYRALYPA
jgi:hypothetical protein